MTEMMRYVANTKFRETKNKLSFQKTLKPTKLTGIELPKTLYITIHR